MPSVFTFTLIFHRFDDGCCGPEDLKILTALKYFFSARNIGLFCNLLLSGKHTTDYSGSLAKNLTEDVARGGPHMVISAGEGQNLKLSGSGRVTALELNWPTAA